MLVIPTQPVPNQNFSVTLDGQQVSFNIYQTAFGMFLDMILTNVPLITGQLCINQEPMVQEAYLGFSGDIIWVDTMGTEDPVYTGLGTRFQLVHLEPADLAAA